MSNEANFLTNRSPRRISLQGTASVDARLFLGNGQLATEIVVYEAHATPANSNLRTLWKARNKSRPTPVVVVALHGENKASICGATGDEPPVFLDLDRGQVERMCDSILDCPDRNQAIMLFGRVAESLPGPLPGIRNEGLLTDHELSTRSPLRSDWESASKKGLKAIGSKDQNLLTSLGYTIERCDNHTAYLQDGNKKLSLAVLLESHESPDTASLRFAGLSPVTYALAKADEERLPYVITICGAIIRLYPTNLTTGVGRRGRTETFLEINSSILPDTKAALLWLLMSAEALQPEGSLKEIIDESALYAGNLAQNLRERIYGKVVPRLAQAVVAARKLKKPTIDDLHETYEVALVILFRLLFVAYAEDKDLLPYRHNGLYQKRSLKTKALELLEIFRKETPFDERNSLWEEVIALFNAVDQGNATWSVPRYNGGLFSSDPEVSRTGHLITQIKLSDKDMGPILTDLLLIDICGETGPVDFRSLGVREFGTIYEGLLESELSLAEQDLGLDTKQTYVPAGPRSEVRVKKGEIYLHNSSGARKATGSYFTKDFAVQYQIDKSLVPALTAHFAELDQLDEDEAALQFFDFKVADISMGSAHFLTAAIDRMEADMSKYLAKRSLQRVSLELDTLRQAARNALGDIADQLGPIEDDKLLRRLIASRCIYGVDINPLSVQLSRLAIWIHTFVPGLPLSLLDRTLVAGNSLIGIGTTDEIQKRFQAEDMALFAIDATALLSDAIEPLQRLARITDATYADIKRARAAIEAATTAVAPAKALCDIITAHPLASIIPDDAKSIRSVSNEEKTARAKKLIKWEQANKALKNFQFEDWETQKQSIAGSPAHKRALELLEETNTFHFPIAFPEVFIRKRPGFDVILGNPPWEEITVEEKGFWARYFPGLKSLQQGEYEARLQSLREERPDLVLEYTNEVAATKKLRQILATGPHTMGAGDPDLYKAFVWRFWDLIRSGSGQIGVVLPRSALAAKGSDSFRRDLLDQKAGIDCCFLVNTGEWVFDGVEPRYTVSLTNISKPHDGDDFIYLRGPFASKKAFDKGAMLDIEPVTGKQVRSWNDALSFPLLPNEDSLKVFLQLRKSPRLESDIPGQWKVNPATDFHATADKPMMDLESDTCPEGFWPVFKGESFDHWNPGTGTVYAFMDPEIGLKHLQDKRLNTYTRPSSPYYGITKKEVENIKTLSPYKARIAFRDVTNRTNTRTFIPTLVPPKTFIANQAPYFVFTGTEHDEAFLLGVLSSIPLDWYARRFIELHANFYLVNPFPVPRPKEDCILRKKVIELAGRLACPDERFKEWAKAVGVDYGPLDAETKQDMIHELDAVVAHVYGLKNSQLTHIFETFHVGWDYKPRLKATLHHFDNWKA
jgi:hypothetical protein